MATAVIKPISRIVVTSKEFSGIGEPPADGTPYQRLRSVAGASSWVAGSSATTLYPQFSDQTAYAVNDQVSYEGKSYTFTSIHAAGVWNDDHVKISNDEFDNTDTDLSSETKQDAIAELDNDKVNKEDLSAALYIYPTTTASDIPTYNHAVTSLDDPDFDNPAVDVATAPITASDQLLAIFATEINIIVGNPGVITLTTTGGIRRVSGSGTSGFYFKVFNRDSGDAETLIATSNITPQVESATYQQFYATALLNDGEFLSTDRIIIKWYSSRGLLGSDPVYEFQLGGGTPTRTSFPAPLKAIPVNHETLENVGDNTHDEIDAYLATLINNSVIAREATGFTAPEDVGVSYDPAARTVSLSGTVNAYWLGEQIEEINNTFVSDPHPAILDEQFFLVHNGTTFIWKQLGVDTVNFWDILICLVIYGTDDKYALRECHGLMPWQVHRWLHENAGTVRHSGGTLGDYVIDSSTPADRRPSLSQSVVNDEDLPTVIVQLIAEGTYTNYLLTGAGGDSVIDTVAVDVVPLNGDIPYYNEYTGGVWTQTPLANKEYMSIWVYLIPTTIDTESQKYRILFAQGQVASQTLEDISGASPASYNPGALADRSPEMVICAHIVIQYLGGNWFVREVSEVFGSKYEQSSRPGGIGLTSVFSGDTMTGSGTSSDPLDQAQYTTTFDNTDLTAGILSVNHALSIQFCSVQIVNAASEETSAGTITYTDTNNLEIYFGSYPLSGTFNLIVRA